MSRLALFEAAAPIKSASERVTWADRSLGRARDVAARLAHFNLTTGAVSIGGNLLMMRILVGAAHAPLLLGNCLSVAACSVMNYLVNDRWVFGGFTCSKTTFKGKIVLTCALGSILRVLWRLKALQVRFSAHNWQLLMRHCFNQFVDLMRFAGRKKNGSQRLPVTSPE